MKIFFIEHKEDGLLLTDFENDYKINNDFSIETNGDYNSERYLEDLKGDSIEALMDAAADEGFRIIDDPKNRSRARYMFGRQIAKTRKACGMGQTALAEKCGIKLANLISIENGRYAASFDNINKIAEVLGKKLTLA